VINQLLFYADDMDLLGYNIDTTKKKTKNLQMTIRGAGLEANAEKTSICCSLITRMQG
jgi:hypothetical protein